MEDSTRKILQALLDARQEIEKLQAEVNRLRLPAKTFRIFYTRADADPDEGEIKQSIVARTAGEALTTFASIVDAAQVPLVSLRIEEGSVVNW